MLILELEEKKGLLGAARADAAAARSSADAARAAVSERDAALREYARAYALLNGRAHSVYWHRYAAPRGRVLARMHFPCGRHFLAMHIPYAQVCGRARAAAGRRRGFDGRAGRR